MDVRIGQLEHQRKEIWECSRYGATDGCWKSDGQTKLKIKKYSNKYIRKKTFWKTITKRRKVLIGYYEARQNEGIPKFIIEGVITGKKSQRKGKVGINETDHGWYEMYNLYKIKKKAKERKF